MKGKQKVISLLGILTVITVLISFIAVLLKCKQNTSTSNINPEILRSMEYAEVDDNGKVENTDYVTFNAFFTRDLDNDGNAEKLLGTCRRVNQTDVLYMDLNVLSNGYLKDGKITINGENFKYSMSMVKDSVLKNNYISDDVRVIALNDVPAGTQKLILGNVISKIGNDTNNYSKINSVTLTGTHVYQEEGKEDVETPIEKTIDLTVDWHGQTSASIPYISPVYYNYDEFDGDTISFAFTVSEGKQELILKENIATVTIPELNGYAPTAVTCSNSNIESTYDEETKVLTIKRESKCNEQGIVTNTLSRQNMYTVNVTYPKEAFEAINYYTALTIPVTGKYTGYNNINPEFTSPYVSNLATGKVTVVFREKPVTGFIYNFYVDFMDTKYITSPYNHPYYAREIKSKQWLLNLYEDYENSTLDIDEEDKENARNEFLETIENKEYIVRWLATRGSRGEVPSMIMTETKNAGNVKYGDKWDSTIMEPYTHNAGIYFANADTMLEEDGYIKVYKVNDDGTEELIHTFTKDDWNSYTKANPYKYDEAIKHVKVETSKTNLNSSLSVYHVKELETSKILESFTKEQVKDVDVCYTYLTGICNIEGQAQGKVNDVDYFYYVSEMSNAQISVAVTQIPTQETLKNEKIYIETLCSSEVDAKWKNGEFIVELPEDIISMNINSITASNGVNILAYDLYQKNGKYLIKIITENDEPTTYKITIDCNVVPSPTTATTNKAVKLYAHNENCNDYYYNTADIYDVDSDNNKVEQVGTSSTTINFLSPTSLITLETISNYNNLNEVTYAPNVAEVAREVSKATVNVSLTNNYPNTVTGVQILGKIPFEGNTYIINGSDMKSKFSTTMTNAVITLPSELQGKATIYYSENENPTNDILDENNGWTTEPTDFSKVKTYLIDMKKEVIQVGKGYTFNYEINIPENADYNLASYCNHAVYYELTTEGGKLALSTEPNKVGVRIVKKFDLELIKYKLNSTIKIPGVTYTLKYQEENLEGELEEKTRILTTDDEGKINLENLYVEKEYELQEFRVPNICELNNEIIRFKINEDGTLTLNGNVKESEFVEDKLLKISLEDEVKYNLEINKTKIGENEPISGVRFKLQDEYGNIEKVRTQNGIAILEGLRVNKIYTLTEMSVPTYCELNNGEFTFKLLRNEEGNLEVNTITNTLLSGDILINDENLTPEVKVKVENELKYELNLLKKDDKGNSLKQVQFTIKGDGFGTQGTKYSTNNEGKFTAYGLSFGKEYILEETKGEGYYLDSTANNKIIFKVEKQDSGLSITKWEEGEAVKVIGEPSVSEDGLIANLSVVIENETIPTYDLKLVKVNKDGEKLQGAEFKLTSQDTGKVQTKTVNEIGELTFEGLYEYVEGKYITGEYTLEETFAPEGYQLNSTHLKFKSTRDENSKVQITILEGDSIIKDAIEETTTKEISSDENTLIINILNKPIFKLAKYGDNNKLLPNTKFAVTDRNGNTAIGSDGVEIGEDEVINGGTYKVLTTDENGEISANFAEGMYKLVEVQAPGGYDLTMKEKDRTYYVGIGRSQEKVSGPATSVKWAKSISADLESKFNQVIATDDDGVIAVGKTYTTDIGGDGQGDISGKGNDDGIVRKYDKNGNVEWQRILGGIYNEEIKSITKDVTGGYVIAGYTDSNEVYLDDTLIDTNYFGHEDGIIVKLDDNGNYVWSQSVGGTGVDHINSVAVSDTGEVAVVGSYTSTELNIDKDETDLLENQGRNADNTTNKNKNAFIIVYSNTGSYIWSQNIGGTDDTTGVSVTNTNSGFAVAVNFIGTTYFNTDKTSSLASKGMADGAVIWYMGRGEIQKVQQVGSSSNDNLTQITTDNNGNIYVTGSYANSITLGGTTIATKGKYDGIVIKYSSIGDYVTYKKIGGYNDDTISSVYVTDDEGLVLGGWYYSSALDLNNDGANEITTYSGICDALVMKLDSNLNLQWYDSIKGTEYDEVLSVVETTGKDVVVVGDYDSESLTIFNEANKLTNSQYTDALIVRYETEEIEPEIPELQELEVHNELIKYKVTTEIGINSEGARSGGTITGNYNEQYQASNNVKFVETIKYGYDSTEKIAMTPDNNYIIKSITINGESVGWVAKDDGSYEIPEGYFKDVKQDYHIVVTYVRKKQNLIINKVDVNDNSKKLAGAKFKVEQIEDRPYPSGAVGSLYGNSAAHNIPSTNVTSQALTGAPTNGSSYYFVQNGSTYTSNNNGVSSSTAYTYVPIDLRDSSFSGTYTVTVNATISSESGYDKGTVSITNSSKSNISTLISGVSGVNTYTQSYTSLSAGNLYYVYMTYSKDGSVNSNSDNFTINSINVYKNETAYYNFTSSNGKYISSNQGQNNTTSNSYIPIDLNGKKGKYTLTVNAEVSSESGCDYGYATVTTNTSRPAYNNSTGRFIYISGSYSTQGSIVLQGGTTYYLHLGYYKNASNSSGSDTFTVNSVSLSLNTDDFYSGEHITNTNGQILLEGLPLWKYKITETEAPEGYALNPTPMEVNLTEDGLNLTITNDSDIPPYEITKIDKETNNPIAGVKFEIYNVSEEYETLNLIKTAITDTNGKISLLLSPGIYKAVEVEAPSGYVLDENINLRTTYFKVSNNKTLEESNENSLEENSSDDTSSNVDNNSGETAEAYLVEIDRAQIPEITVNIPEEADIEIEYIEDLIDFQRRVNKGEDFAGQTIRLVRNLNFNNTNSYRNSEDTTTYGDYNGDETVETIKTELSKNGGFKPIGSDDKPFKGKFDGNGKEIQNIYISSSLNAEGLFGVTKGATIANLKVTGSVSGSSNKGLGAIAGSIEENSIIYNCSAKIYVGGTYVAGVVGNANNSKISKCTSELTGGGGTYVGGIVSNANNGTIITECISKNFNAGGSYVAGIVAKGDDIIIYNCENQAKMTSAGYYGGIASQISNSRIIDCKNVGMLGSGSSTGGIAANTNNVIIQGCTNEGEINGGNYTGGIVGDAINSTILNCNNKAVLNSGNATGGIAGNIKDCKILKCNNESNLNCSNVAGGIVGFVDSNSTNNEIKNCNNTAKITSNGTSTGGITGNSIFKTTISNCKNTGDIINNYSNNARVGGIIAYDANDSTVNNCINEGKLSCNYNYSYLGGIVGHCTSNTKINNCTNKGDLITSQNGVYMAGIVGYTANNSEINKCKNEGLIECTDQYNAIAGIVLYANNSSITECDNSGKINATNSTNAAGIVYSTSNCKIEKCTNNAEVFATYSSGGIACYANGTEIIDCTNYGKLTNTNNSVAGIVNSVSYTTINNYRIDSVIKNCNNMANITSDNSNAAGIVCYGSCFTMENCNNNGEIHGKYSVGGIANSISGVDIINCTNSQKVTSTNSQAGGIVYYIGTTTINNNLVCSKMINCHNDGEVYGSSGAGGIAYNAYATRVVGCTNSKKVTADNAYATGIIEYVSYATNQNKRYDSIIIDCYNSGDVESKGSEAGGIVLYAYCTSIVNCQNDGEVNGYNGAGGIAYRMYGCKIINCTNLKNVTGTNSMVAGIVQYATTTTVNSVKIDSTIINTANLGNVESKNSTAGGLVQETNYCTILNCYNLGNVTTNSSNAGGLVRLLSNSTISNCYNAGIVKSNSSAGGIITNLSNTNTITNCYYLNTTASQGIYGNSDVVGKAEAKTKDEMQSQVFADLLNSNQQSINTNFALSTWKYDDSYPTFDELVQEVASLTVTNQKEAEYNLIIKKVDENTEKGLKGAKFKIQGTDSSYLQEFVSNSDGEIKVNLPVGNYKVTEIQAPDGYKLSSETKKINVTRYAKELIFKNRIYESSKERYSFIMTKEDKLTKAIMPGVKFMVLDEEGNYARDYYGEVLGEKQTINGQEKYIVTTDEAGQIKLKLDVGKYKLVEVQTLEGYALEDEIEFEITAENIRWTDIWDANVIQVPGNKNKGYIIATSDMGMLQVNGGVEKTIPANQTVSGTEDITIAEDKGYVAKYNDSGKLENLVQFDGIAELTQCYQDSEGNYIVLGKGKEVVIPAEKTENGEQITLPYNEGEDHYNTILLKLNSDLKVVWGSQVYNIYPYSSNNNYIGELEEDDEIKYIINISPSQSATELIIPAECTNDNVANSFTRSNAYILIKYNKDGKAEKVMQQPFEINNMVEKNNGKYVISIISWAFRMSSEMAWEKSPSSPSGTSINTAYATMDEGLIFAGTLNNNTTISGDATESGEPIELTSDNLPDTVLIKYNKYFDIEWAKVLSFANSGVGESLYSIKEDEQGNLIAILKIENSPVEYRLVKLNPKGKVINEIVINSSDITTYLYTNNDNTQFIVHDNQNERYISYSFDSRNIKALKQTVTNQKAGKVIVHHLLEGTGPASADENGVEHVPAVVLADEEILNGKIPDEYTTLPKMDIKDYALIKGVDGEYVIPDNASGYYEEEEQHVYYYYNKKPVELIVHHYLEGTEDSVPYIEDEQELVVEDEHYYYEKGEHYKTNPSAKALEGYELVSVVGDTEKDIYENEEVTYYYRIKEHTIITMVEVPEERDPEDKGGTITGEGETPYETVEHGKSSIKDIIITPDEGYRVREIRLVSVNKDAGTENGSNSENETGVVETRKECVIYGKNAVEDAEITYSYLPDGTIILTKFENMTEDKEIIVVFEPDVGRVIVHHYIEGTTEKIYDDQITEDLIGKEVTTMPVKVGNYVLVEEPEDRKAIITEEIQERTYYYQEQFVITTDVIEHTESYKDGTIKENVKGGKVVQVVTENGNGSSNGNQNTTEKTLNDNEVVEKVLKNRANKETIKIVPDEGYEIVSVVIKDGKEAEDGVIYEFSDKLDEDGSLTLEAGLFPSMQSDKHIEVEFRKKSKVIVKHLEVETEKVLYKTETGKDFEEIQGYESAEFETGRKVIQNYIGAEVEIIDSETGNVIEKTEITDENKQSLGEYDRVETDKKQYANGTMYADEITLIYWYKRATSGIIVRHIEINEKGEEREIESKLVPGEAGLDQPTTRNKYDKYISVDGPANNNENVTVVAKAENSKTVTFDENEILEVWYYYEKQYEITTEVKPHEETIINKETGKPEKVIKDGGTISKEYKTDEQGHDVLDENGNKVEDVYETVLSRGDSSKTIVITPDDGYRIKSIIKQKKVIDENGSANGNTNGKVTIIEEEVFFENKVKEDGSVTLEKAFLTDIQNDYNIVVEFERIPAKVIVEYRDVSTKESIHENKVINGLVYDEFTTNREKIADYITGEVDAVNKGEKIKATVTWLPNGNSTTGGNGSQGNNGNNNGSTGLGDVSTGGTSTGTNTGNAGTGNGNPGNETGTENTGTISDLIAYIENETHTFTKDVITVTYWYTKEFKITTDVKEHEETVINKETGKEEKVSVKGGTISGEDEAPYEKVTRGNSSTKVIVIQPDENYRIKTVTINDKVIEIKGYIKEDEMVELPLFENMQEDKHIVVEFEKIPAKVIIEHLDVDTNKPVYRTEEGKDYEEINGFVNEEYSTKEKEIEYYELVKEKYPENSKGTMTEEDTVVIYYYKKLPFNMKVEKEIKDITLNGIDVLFKDKKKAEVKVKYSDISEVELEVSYRIKVTNTEKIEGKAMLEENLPEGFEFVMEKSNANWQVADITENSNNNGNESKNEDSSSNKNANDDVKGTERTEKTGNTDGASNVNIDEISNENNSGNGNAGNSKNSPNSENSANGVNGENSKNSENSKQSKEIKYILITENIKPEETKEYIVTLRWSPNEENNGEKVNIAKITETNNKPKFEETTKEDNEDKAIIEVKVEKIPEGVKGDSDDEESNTNQANSSKPSKPSSKPEETPDMPKTGQTRVIYITTAVIMITSAGVIFIKKRQWKNEK